MAIKKSTKGKKALIVGGIVLGSFLIFGYKKLDEAKKVLEFLDFSIKKVSKVKVGLKNISFSTVIELVNPTAIDFGATASSFIALKEIRVYSPRGVYMGRAETNLYQIKLPARSKVELEEISFNIESKKALNEFLSFPEILLNNDFGKLKYKIDINAFGNIITIDA